MILIVIEIDITKKCCLKSQNHIRTALEVFTILTNVYLLTSVNKYIISRTLLILLSKTLLSSQHHLVPSV